MKIAKKKRAHKFKVINPDPRYAFKQANARALKYVETLLRDWVPEGKMLDRKYYVALNPTRDDRHLGSFKINIKTGYWRDFATDDKGSDLISLAAYLYDITQGEAMSLILQRLEKRP